MLTLADVRDYIASLEISLSVYCGKLDDKKEKSIGIYPLKNSHMSPLECIGAESSYNTKGISILIHWNKSPRDTETASYNLYEILKQCKDVTINGKTIKFIKHSYNEPVSVDTDDNGIYEYVIECLFYYER